MQEKQYPKIKKRFIIGMSPALITLALVTIAICLLYAAFVH